MIDAIDLLPPLPNRNTMDSASCPCVCHGQSATFGACSINGGCGHLHSAAGDFGDPSLKCYRGTRCTDVRKRTATNPDGSTRLVKIPARATAPGLLCRMDTTITRTAIEQLPMDYLELSTILGKTTSIGLPASGSGDLPVPIRLGITVLATAIVDELERWAEVVADAAGFWYHPTGDHLHRLRNAASWVAGRYERFLTLPPTWHQRLDADDPHMSGKDSSSYTLESGLDGALRLLALHEHTTAVAGRTRRAERLHSPCPQCTRRALEHDEGSSHVDCRRCRYRMTLKAYEQRASVLARVHEDDLKSRTHHEPMASTASEPPMAWADGTIHTGHDIRSNMMLDYVSRHTDANPSTDRCA